MINISSPIIGDEEKKAVLEVLDSGFIAQGPKVKAFEEAFAAMCGVKFAIATSSGTTALHLALLAHGIGEGDEVITSPFTFIASANSVLFTGARPVFVDIDPTTFNLDANQIEAKITRRTRAKRVSPASGHCKYLSDTGRAVLKAERLEISNSASIRAACETLRSPKARLTRPEVSSTPGAHNCS